MLHGAGPLKGYFIDWKHLVPWHILCDWPHHMTLYMACDACTITNHTYNHQCAYMLFNQTVQWVVMSHCLLKQQSSINRLWKGLKVQITHRGEWHIPKKLWRGAPRQLQSPQHSQLKTLNPLNPELNPICYLLALLAHHFLHVSRIMVKSLTLRLLMSYIYGAHILDVSRSHTMTHHSR